MAKMARRLPGAGANLAAIVIIACVWSVALPFGAVFSAAWLGSFGVGVLARQRGRGFLRWTAFSMTSALVALPVLFLLPRGNSTRAAI